MIRAALALLLLVPGAAVAQSSRHGLTPLGNPSELVAAESALAHLARDKGAAVALNAMAEPTAEFIAPVRTPARAWLAKYDADAWFADRQTTTVWASCDGTAGVSAGQWRSGWFTTVWRRQKKLNFLWVLADAAPMGALPPAPDFISGTVADCPPRVPHDAGLPPLPGAIPASAADSRDGRSDVGQSEVGRSDDGSLVWRSTVLADGSRALTVWLWRDGAMHAVVDRRVPR